MLTNQVDKITYQGNGSNVNFPIAHDIIVNDQNETLVYVRDETDPLNPTTSLKVYGALQDYTLTGANPPTTPFNNNVQFNIAPTSTQKVIVVRFMPLTELLNLLTSGTFDYKNIDVELMRIVAMLQQLNELILRAPLLAITEQIGQLVIPEPVKNTLIGFDSVPTPTLKLYPLTQADSLASNFETQVAVNDNSSGQVLTGVNLDSSIYSLITITCSILRKSANGTLREKSKIVLSYDDVNSVWRLSNTSEGPDLCGVTFHISTTNGIGTMTFDTDSFSLGGASYVGKLRYKTLYESFLKET